ncbi:MAG: hypothetical protein IRY90_12360 [Actinomadura rubrobrunea]|nr:hypothetical protein [Actinomadura rubrobrunea]
MFALGDVEAAARRVAEHRQAGADHVAIQVVTAGRQGLTMREWRELAVLTGDS